MTDPAALPNFPPPPDEHPLRGRVLDALIDMQLGPNIDDDGDVAFTVNEQSLFVRCLEADVTLMRVFGQWQIAAPVPDDELVQLRACNDVNLAMNLVRTGLANGTLVGAVDHLVLPNDDVAGLLGVSIQVVLTAVQLWHQRVLGIDPTNPDGRPDPGAPPTPNPEGA